MPIIDIQQLSKLYYSIGEVSKLLNVNPSLLRFWEKEFQLEVSKKNKKGNRLFTKKDIDYLTQIIDSINVLSPCSNKLFYMTWGYKNGN